MATLGDNPFAVLTAVVAPAILTNACSVLSLGTGNRIARVVDRTRVVTAEMSELRSGTPEYQALMEQLQRLQMRSRLLLQALRIFYGALGAFAAAALVSIIGSVLSFYDLTLGFRVAAAIGLISGAGGVIGLVAASVAMVRETQIAVEYLAEESELALAPKVRK